MVEWAAVAWLISTALAIGACAWLGIQYGYQHGHREGYRLGVSAARRSVHPPLQQNDRGDGKGH